MYYFVTCLVFFAFAATGAAAQVAATSSSSAAPSPLSMSSSARVATPASSADTGERIYGLNVGHDLSYELSRTYSLFLALEAHRKFDAEAESEWSLSGSEVGAAYERPFGETQVFGAEVALIPAVDAQEREDTGYRGSTAGRISWGYKPTYVSFSASLAFERNYFSYYDDADGAPNTQDITKLGVRAKTSKAVSPFVWLGVGAASVLAADTEGQAETGYAVSEEVGSAVLPSTEFALGHEMQRKVIDPEMNRARVTVADADSSTFYAKVKYSY